MVRPALLILLSTLAWGLAAQDAAPGYVSRLSALPGTSSVLLTWQDPEGWPGATYEVWRSSKEILRDGLPQAKLLATVAEGVEAYEDKTAAGPSYYLVLVKDAAGNRQGFFVPFRNKTTTPVQPQAAGPLTTAKVKVGEPTYASPQVVIPFQAFPPDRKLTVLRRAAPIATAADLKDATVLGSTTGAAGPWKDTPAPGLEFYYALVDAQAWSDGRSDAFGPDNATTRAVGFPLVTLTPEAKAAVLDNTLRPSVDTGARSLPLPRLQVGTEPDSGRALATSAYEPVVPKALVPQADAELQKWSKAPASAPSLPPPAVLAEERSAAADGAGKYLVQIQRAYLAPKDWDGAAAALENVLKLTLDERTEARARFYLGEAQAYQGNYRRAFVEILAARDLYPAETRPFLEALFSLLGSTPD